MHIHIFLMGIKNYKRKKFRATCMFKIYTNQESLKVKNE